MKIEAAAKKETSTPGVQFLLLYYLGLIDHFRLKNIKDSATLLKYLFNSTGTVNIGKFFSAVGKKGLKSSPAPFSYSNLKEVCVIFEKFGFNDALVKAKIDMEKRKPKI